MKVDNPSAFRFILDDEIYLLATDKAGVNTPAAQQLETPTATVETAIKPATAELPDQPATTVITKTTVQPSPSDIKTPGPEFNYLGSNNKNFVILLNYANEEFIPAAHLTALQSMLQRKGFGLDDVAIVNINRYAPVTLAKLAEVFKPVKLLIMGKDSLPQGIGILPVNQPVQGKKTNVLYSLSFTEMMDSNEMKKAFWDQMKAL